MEHMERAMEKYMSSGSRVYGEDRDPIPVISEPFVIFMINRSFDPGRSDELDIYRATQCSWVVGGDVRDRAVYALGVANGVVRGAYRIEGWRHVGGNRWCFDGRTARELNVRGKSILRIKGRKGDARAVVPFLNGIPDPEVIPPENG